MVPPQVDAASAVCLVMDYFVAYQMLTRKVSLSADDTILIQGAGGGVGTAMMDSARDGPGHRPGDEATPPRVVRWTTDRLRTGGRGQPVPGTHRRSRRRRLLRRNRSHRPRFPASGRPGGRLVWFGMLTFLTGGDRDLRGVAKTALSLARVFAPNALPGGKRTSLYSIQHLADKHPHWYRQDLSALLDLLVVGTINPRVAAVWELDSVPEAVTALSAGAVPGKQVVTMDGRQEPQAMRFVLEILVGALWLVGASFNAGFTLRHAEEFYTDFVEGAWVRPARRLTEWLVVPNAAPFTILLIGFQVAVGAAIQRRRPSIRPDGHFRPAAAPRFTLVRRRPDLSQSLSS